MSESDSFDVEVPLVPTAEEWDAASHEAWMDDALFLEAWGGYDDNHAFELAADAVAADRRVLRQAIEALPRKPEIEFPDDQAQPMMIVPMVLLADVIAVVGGGVHQ